MRAEAWLPCLLPSSAGFLQPDWKGGGSSPPRAPEQAWQGWAVLGLLRGTAGPPALTCSAAGRPAPGAGPGGPGPGPGRAGRLRRGGRESALGGHAGSTLASHPRPGQVSEDELVSTLKHLVSEKLNVPVRQQRLLFKGKALADGKRLSDYSIGPNSKLNLVVRPLEKVLLEESTTRRLAETPAPPPPAWQLISKVLARHFSAADASRVLDQLQRDYERSLSRLTLDDIERLASRFLHPEVTEAMEKGFS
ncbi:ubiquitin-like protein 4A [Equus quagga]|uniref:ubiquitin-like protein 4A n=1 Tax=Equus quagga TaxID=89248 RepID=UPI001EE268DB|nr:ubiquitin-like protein 4A [Equus quagga]